MRGYTPPAVSEVELSKQLDDAAEVVNQGLGTKTGRRSAAKLQSRNDLLNPRAISLTGWTRTVTAGGSSSISVLDDDPDVGDGALISATHASTPNFVGNLFIGNPPNTNGVVHGASNLIFGRAKVHIDAAPEGTVTVILTLSSTDSGGANATSQVLDQRDGIEIGDTVTVEGFDLVPATAVRSQLIVSVRSALVGTITFRAGSPQIVLEPATDVPEYGDGTRTGWAWEGTADASASRGPVSLNDSGKWGYNDHSYIQATPQLTPSQLADLLVESGAGYLRNGIVAGNVWPTEDNGPNWTSSIYGQICEELRERGLKWLPLIGNSPGWMNTGGLDSGPQEGLLQAGNHDAWIAMYADLVTKYPDVIEAVQFSNEPNITAAPDPETFTAAMIEMYDGLKAVRSDLTFVGPGIARAYQSSDGRIKAYDYLSDMYAAGAKGHMDALAIHPYPPIEPSSGPPASPSNANHHGVNELFEVARLVLREQNDEVPIWVTETGLVVERDTVGSAAGIFERHKAQTDLMLRGMIHRSGAEMCIIHQLQGFQSSLETFQTVEKDTRLKLPAFYALRDGGLPASKWYRATLINSWVNQGNFEARYRREGNTGYLKGIIKSGTINTVAFALPEWMRPSETRTIVTVSNNGTSNVLGVLGIGSNGNVNPNTGSNTLFYLDVSFQL